MADFFVERLAADLAAEGQELAPAWRAVLSKPHYQLAGAESALYACGIGPRRAELRARLRRIYEREGRPEAEWRAALEAARVGPALPVIGELVHELWADEDAAPLPLGLGAPQHPLWGLLRAWGLLLLVLGTVGGFLLGGPVVGAGGLALLVAFAVLSATRRGRR